MKKPSFTKNLLGFVCLFIILPCYTFSQTFFGVGSVPADNTAQAGPTPPAITPPASMLAGDLVVIYGEYRAAGIALSMNQAGGQTWATIAANSGSNQSTAIFWCTFNGTWSTNPSIKVPVGNTNGMTAVMYVFRPSSNHCTWVLNVNNVTGGPSSTNPITINSVSPNAPHTVTMAFWSCASANTWGTLSGTGWSKTGLNAQNRNTNAGTNQSNTAAYYIQTTTTGATGSVSQNESAATATVTSILSWAQSPDNDNCADATLISSGTTGTLYAATGDGGSITSTCTAVASQDVWYKFVAEITNPTITVGSLGGSWGTNLKIQVLSGTCGSFTEVACANNAPVTPTLTVGNTYYIRIHKATLTAPTGSAAGWAFEITIDPSPKSRMSEVWQRTVISSNAINTPWEVTYGPDGYLWVTGSHDYKAYRIDPGTGTKTTILDLSNATPDFPAIKVQFNNATQNPWPQGGFAGLAIHPEFNTGKPYVYISYVNSYVGGSSGPGYFFKNSIVKFTYNSGTGKLESPEVLVDTLPGSSDHNSQRMTIARVTPGGPYFLFYGQGDMGAGQLTNATRSNHAQVLDDYEGKILRFNLESDGESGFDAWIPNDNPYNATLGKQSAVWAMGIRNNQGFAYDTAKNILYASQHGPYSDDEINIIQEGKNYGHPLVIGYADGNYNGSSAGVPNNGASSLAVITDEIAAAAAIPNYKDPLFSGYAAVVDTISKIWTTNPSNQTWPSEAWSGIDIYKNTAIPGWKNSLIICGLKWGRVLRLKLSNAGDSVEKTAGADTIAYFQSKNRYRDLAISPNGRSLYVADEGTSATGPGGISPPITVPGCTNCIINYTFLGYADAGGKSSIPDAIPVSDTSLSDNIPVNTVDSATTVTVDNTNNMLWVPITGPDGNILAEIYPNGNNLGVVRTAFYKHSGAIRVKSGIHYLDRNITITPDNQPSVSNPVKIRLYLTQDEFNSLDVDPLSGISAITDLKILTNEDPCSAAIGSSTTFVPMSFEETHDGSNGYMLQGTVTKFSSFYFANANVALPLNLLTFKGSLQNNNTVLQWETSNEVNTSHFIIERSTDGQSFQQIGTTPALGGANGNKYSFTDYDASQQSSLILYYRLKMVDTDGGYTYSDIVTIVLSATSGKITVFPNPTSHEIMVTIAASADAQIRWSITDNGGRVVMQNSTQIKKGNNKFSINLNNLSTGFYYLSVSGGGIDKKIKIEKL